MTLSKRSLSRVGFVLSSVCIGLAACGDEGGDEAAEAAELAEGCDLPSDCAEPLVCTFERCHAECEESRDCRGDEGERCVLDEEGNGVCQLPDEAECSRNSDCAETQTCAADGQCRNECSDAGDCLDGQECATSGSCADVEELDPDGGLPGEPGEGGAGGAPAATGGMPATTGGTQATGGTMSEGGDGGMPAEGGTTGEGGTPSEGGMGGEPSMEGDICSQPDVGNDDRDTATPYELGTDVNGCLQSDADVDFYEFTIPEGPAQGGYVVYNVHDVGTDGGLYVYTYSATDNGQITYFSGAAGTNVTGWFAAAAGQTYRAAVERSGTIAPDYVFQATYTGLEDQYEPNDTQEDAAPIELDETIEGYAFNGYTDSMNPGNPPADDWYQVDLSAGSVTATLDPPPGVSAYLYIYDDTGGSYLTYVGANNGAQVVLERPGLALGTYFFKVERYSSSFYVANESMVTAGLLEPYTLLIEQ